MAWGEAIWQTDPDAAYAEAVRRIAFAGESDDPEARRAIYFSDLQALRVIPPGLGQLPDLRAVFFEQQPSGQPNIGSLRSIEDLSPLAEVTQIEVLDLRYTGVSDLTPISGLTALTSLSFGSTTVSDLAPISGLTALTSLSFGSTTVSDLAPISGLTALTSLSFNNTKVSDLAPISGLAALTSLSLDRTGVSDLTPISGLTALTSLSFDNTWVSDLTPISGLSALTSLSFGDTGVTDLAPLLDLPEFRALKAKRLSYFTTGRPIPAMKADRRLDMIGRLPSDRCAIETIQYLLGEHPDFRNPPISANTKTVEQRLSQAAPYDVIAHNAALAASPRDVPAPPDPARRAELATGHLTLTAQLLTEMRRAQVDRSWITRFDRYRTALSQPFVIFESLEVLHDLMQASLSDPANLAELETGLKEGLTLWLQRHAELRPLYQPPAEAVAEREALVDDPETDEEELQELAEGLGQVLNSAEFAPLAVRLTVNVETSKAELTMAKQQPEARRIWVKRAAIGLAGVVSGIVAFGSEAVTIHGWWVAQNGPALVQRLQPYWEALVRMFTGG